MNHLLPRIVKRMPPCLLHSTLHKIIVSQCDFMTYGVLPCVDDWNDSCGPVREVNEGRHGKIEVLLWVVAPSSSVALASGIWRAEVRGGDGDGEIAGTAPLWILMALELVASSTGSSVLEQDGAQSGGLHSKAFVVHVAIAASSSCERRSSQEDTRKTSTSRRSETLPIVPDASEPP
ncbi:uncharacterized protein LOC112350317 isoform X2 [Selaginella moellendorffii]|uniref:uncharacterized protein LOC112350317 isoform X2 n=1 Tax=Selaginella moellendorffii TaxID=88036 RepID=UPI000D1C30E9|nr:uncharacterized protein LOC112350317 isoform X2 [Selaginella moellendorffii]|eukprot:XP_024542059.1 uncharacterized protein LOC112350317 isoform X2 [Selaginella moellendorffii]